MKIYVASSWRNDQQQGVVQALRLMGFEVYDFRHPNGEPDGFHWGEIDLDWMSWTPEDLRKALDSDHAQHGYGLDFGAMRWADAFVGVEPFGRSASMEMGWAAGNGKFTALLMSERSEPELMTKMFDHLCVDMGELEEVLRAAKERMRYMI